MPLAPGDVIDRFTVLEKLGAGGMGEVYRARDDRLGRDVALKLLRGETGDGSTLLKEARAAAALDHPNVVAIYDVGEAASPDALLGTVYMTMELVGGKTLRRFVGDKSVSAEERVRWLADVARALGAAHRRGLVHRDVKPANVMVRDDGLVKILDFGIARRARSALGADAPTQTDPGVTTSSASGQVAGTPAYMAPEQLMNEPLDGRTDQFAWGVVAHELLTGKRPWTSEGDPIHLVAEILSREASSAPLSEAGVPANVRAVVLRALSKSRDDRFPSMDELALALEKEEPREAPAEAPMPAPVEPRPPRSRGVRIAVIAGAIVAAAVLVSFAGGREDVGVPPIVSASAPAPRATSRPETAATETASAPPEPVASDSAEPSAQPTASASAPRSRARAAPRAPAKSSGPPLFYPH